MKTSIVALCLAAGGAVVAAPPRPATFSIVAADPEAGEVGVAVELVQAAEHLEEDLLGEVLGGVVPPRELVGDVEDLALEPGDDLLPRRVVAT